MFGSSPPTCSATTVRVNRQCRVADECFGPVAIMSDLLDTLPDFNVKPYSHLLHSLEKNDVTVNQTIRCRSLLIRSVVRCDGIQDDQAGVVFLDRHWQLVLDDLLLGF